MMLNNQKGHLGEADHFFHSTLLNSTLVPLQKYVILVNLKKKSLAHQFLGKYSKITEVELLRRLKTKIYK